MAQATHDVTSDCREVGALGEVAVEVLVTARGAVQVLATAWGVQPTTTPPDIRPTMCVVFQITTEAEDNYSNKDNVRERERE